jgi:hypothetical protein
MADRFENGSTENDTGGMSGDRLEHGFDDTDKAFYQGGDLKGLLARIDYIQGLGSTSIWLTPSFKNKAVQLEDGPSAGYHGYWVTDFTQIDPHLGTNAELRALVDKAHQRGMKVYFDIITNHTADVIGYREGARTAYVPKTESSEPKITVAAQLTRAVPRLLTLYMACTPCTAAITHAAWDVDIQAAPGTTTRPAGQLGVLSAGDPVKTAVERGWRSPTRAAIVMTASTTATHVVLPPTKLQARGKRIS